MKKVYPLISLTDRNVDDGETGSLKKTVEQLKSKVDTLEQMYNGDIRALTIMLSEHIFEREKAFEAKKEEKHRITEEIANVDDEAKLVRLVERGNS
jgi:hypothetical protein